MAHSRMPDSAYSSARNESNTDIELNLLAYLRAEGFCETPLTSVKLTPFDHGQSNPTYRLNCEPSGAKYVLRKQPNGRLLQGAHDVTREARLMRMIYADGRVPVPKVLLIEPDPTKIGTAFFIMEFITGPIYRNPSLPEVKDPVHKRRIYIAMAKVLGAIHGTTLPGSAFQNSNTTSYCRNQLKIWSGQYRQSLTPELPSLSEMSQLQQWLENQLPFIEHKFSTPTISLVHGDFRIDNLVFSPCGSRVLAVLDWELASPSGLGLADLAYSALCWHLPKTGFLKDIALGESPDVLPRGIPTAEEFVASYNQTVAAQYSVATPEWTFCLCLGLFRIASICQGVYSRARQGNASSKNAHQFHEAVPLLARCGLDLIKSSSTPPTRGDFRDAEVTIRLEHFQRNFVLPSEQVLTEHYASAQGVWPERGQRWTPHSTMLTLASKACDEYGLWNLWMSQSCARRLMRLHPDWDWKRLLPHVADDKGRKALTNSEYAKAAIISGMSLFTPALINCSAPDTGNMELLANFGSAEQRQQWLLPLLEGQARSCFAMTEKDVSSSDPTQLQATASLTTEEDGTKYWVINGRKWWTTGACDPRCRVCLFVARTEPDTAPPHRRHSILCIPMDSPGVSVIRPLLVMGYDDAPGGHAEVHFKNVRVKYSALIGHRGGGFDLAQSRLGPGRLHHCARLVGHSKRAIEEIISRGTKRQAFGKGLLDLGGNSERLARSVIAVESAESSVQAAAAELDACDERISISTSTSTSTSSRDRKDSDHPHLSTAAQRALAICKVLVPAAVQDCLDFAVQIHGGGGLSSDHPLAAMWSAARTLRLVDGPDEVHLRTISKLERRRLMDSPLTVRPGIGKSRL